MSHAPSHLVPAASVRRAITAVRRALLPPERADADRIFEVDELGVLCLDERPSPKPALSGLSRRARSRLARPRAAPPAWRLHRRRFEALLAATAPFDVLSAEAITDLAALAVWVAVPAGGRLFTSGERLEDAFVVAQGRFDLSRGVRQADAFNGTGAVSLGVARPGSALGLAAAAGGLGALATATTPLGGSALRIPLAPLVDVALCEPSFLARLVELADLRRRAHLLAASAFAELCGAEGRAGMASLFQRRWLAAGEPLALPGQVLNALALVESGRLALGLRAGAGLERQVAVAGPGQAIGSLAALRSRPCQGLLRAVEPTEVSVLDHEGFRALLAWNPSLVGLPALLAARGELVAGSFFALTDGAAVGRAAWTPVARTPRTLDVRPSAGPRLLRAV